MRLRNPNKEDGRMLSQSELMDYLRLGRTSAIEFAEQANAKIKIGARVLYDRRRIDAALDEMTAV